MLNYVAMGIWGFQLLFSIVVLGLSVTLVKGQYFGEAPVTSKYSTFTGAMGMIAAILGLVSLFVEAIPSLAVMGVDAVAGLLLLGGGIAFVIGLGGVECNFQKDGLRMIQNPLLNQGEDNSRCDTNSGCYGVYFRAGGSESEATNILNGNCQKARADQIIQFLIFGLALGSLFITFLFWKNGKPSSRATYV